MSTDRTLMFVSTPWSTLLSIAFVIAMVTLSWFAWRRSGFAKSQGILELVRIGIALVIAVIFNQPEWVEEFKPNEKPTIAVLWDDSTSMETRDVTEKGSTDRVTRRASISELTNSAAWSSLEEDMDVVIQPFASAEHHNRTDLHQPLSEAMRRFANLSGILMITDGDWNDGPAPIQAATKLRVKGVPVFAVSVGSPTRLPDVELLSLDAPTFGVAGKSVRVPFSIDSTMPRDVATTISLKASDGEVVSKEIRIMAMGRTNDSLVWKPADVGDYTLTLNVPEHPDEMLSENNELTAPIVIRPERLRVLIVESYPRWEYRYLRNALSRDPGVNVSCLLFHPGLDKVGGGNQDYIKEFPAGLDELTEFDVVFLGDVGVEEEQLTAEQCRMIKGLVEHQASGLVFMPGWQGRQFSLLDTELEGLMPAVMDEAQPGGWGSRIPGHFELTELGRRSLLTKLADTQDDNLEVWEDLPGFQWYAPVIRAKSGSEVLAVHKDITNEHGRLPLLITRTFGAGKVLMMATDGAWRWRKGVEDKYHYRFWGQVVRWMAYQRNMAKGDTMRLYYKPDQPRVRQTLALRANVMEPSGEPLSKGEVTARIVAPSGTAETARFTSSDAEWGEFFSHYTTREPGRHEITLFCKETNAKLEASFFVQGGEVERVGRPARPEVLEEIARVTRGRVVSQEKPDQIVDLLASLPEPAPSIRRLQLWSHPFAMAVVVTLLGGFWIGRKMIGLV